MRDRKGWKALGHESFKEYGEKELGYQEAHIYRIVDAAEISLQIGYSSDSPIGESPPPESQLRPLKSLPAAERKAIWDEATRKAEEEEKFVRWWDETVGVRVSLGNNQHRSNSDPRSTISKAAAESDTGISQQQVSRLDYRILGNANIQTAVDIRKSFGWSQQKIADALGRHSAPLPLKYPHFHRI